MCIVHLGRKVAVPPLHERDCASQTSIGYRRTGVPFVLRLGNVSKGPTQKRKLLRPITEQGADRPVPNAQAREKQMRVGRPTYGDRRRGGARGVNRGQG